MGAVQLPEQVLVVVCYEWQTAGTGGTEEAEDALPRADRKIVAARVAQDIVVLVVLVADRAVVDGSSTASLIRQTYHAHNEHNISPGHHW